MSWTLRIHFSGICLFKFIDGSPGNPDLGSPDALEVLLLDTSDPDGTFGDCSSIRPCVHRPRLSVDPRDIENNAYTAIEERLAGPDGRDFVTYALDGVDWEWPALGTPNRLEPKHGWKGRRPARPDQANAPEQWVDWAPDLQDVDSRMAGLRSDNDLSPGQGIVAARLRFPRGRLETVRVGREPKVGEPPYVFQFSPPTGPGDPAGDSRALADRLVLSIDMPGGDSVQPTTASGPAPEIRPINSPRRSVVDVGISNLCSERNLTIQDKVESFLWFWEAVEWNGAEPPCDERLIPFIDPVHFYPRTPSTGLCPPAYVLVEP